LKKLDSVKPGDPIRASVQNELIGTHNSLLSLLSNSEMLKRIGSIFAQSAELGLPLPAFNPIEVVGKPLGISYNGGDPIYHYPPYSVVTLGWPGSDGAWHQKHYSPVSPGIDCATNFHVPGLMDFIARTPNGASTLNAIHSIMPIAVVSGDGGYNTADWGGGYSKLVVSGMAMVVFMGSTVPYNRWGYAQSHLTSTTSITENHKDLVTGDTLDYTFDQIYASWSPYGSLKVVCELNVGLLADTDWAEHEDYGTEDGPRLALVIVTQSRAPLPESYVVIENRTGVSIYPGQTVKLVNGGIIQSIRGASPSTALRPVIKYEAYESASVDDMFGVVVGNVTDSSTIGEAIPNLGIGYAAIDGIVELFTVDHSNGLSPDDFNIRARYGPKPGTLYCSPRNAHFSKDPDLWWPYHQSLDGNMNASLPYGDALRHLGYDYYITGPDASTRVIAAFDKIGQIETLRRTCAEAIQELYAIAVRGSLYRIDNASSRTPYLTIPSGRVISYIYPEQYEQNGKIYPVMHVITDIGTPPTTLEPPTTSTTEGPTTTTPSQGSTTTLAPYLPPTSTTTSPPFVQVYCISGAGTTYVNGEYGLESFSDDVWFFSMDTGAFKVYMYRSLHDGIRRWNIGLSTFEEPEDALYSVISSSPTPPISAGAGWPIVTGLTPNAKVSAGGCPTTTTTSAPTTTTTLAPTITTTLAPTTTTTTTEEPGATGNYCVQAEFWTNGACSGESDWVMKGCCSVSGGQIEFTDCNEYPNLNECYVNPGNMYDCGASGWPPFEDYAVRYSLNYAITDCDDAVCCYGDCDSSGNCYNPYCVTAPGDMFA